MPQINFDEFNTAVQAWAVETTSRLKLEAAALGIMHRPNSPSSRPSVPRIKGNVGYVSGAINRVSFKFPRVLVFAHKGAGKGQGGLIGSRWIDRYGKSQKTNPASLGGQGTRNRKAKPFFNQTMEAEFGIQALATIAAESVGDSITGNFLVK